MIVRLEGLQTIEDRGTSALSWVTGYNTGQREPGDCGMGAAGWLQPQLQASGQGDGAPEKQPQKESQSLRPREDHWRNTEQG